MISKIDSLQMANSIIIDRLKQNNPLLLPLDKYTHHALTNDRFDVLRIAVSEDYDEFVRNYLELVGEVHDVTSYAFTGYSISSQEAKDYIVYPFSRTHLYTSIYPDLLPSLFSVYFNYLKQSEKIRQFGTGVGKGLIIETTNLTKDQYDSLRNPDYKEVVDLMVIVSEQIAKQNTDIEYLLKKVEILTEEKNLLLSEVNTLNQMVINTSITTWR